MVTLAPVNTSVIKPRPTLAKDIYPGIAESEDLTKLQIDGQPLAAPEEITLAKAILDAMATAAKTATEALNAAGDAVLSKAINDKKISKERADKLWDAMLHSKNSLYKLIEARKMRLACDQKNPRPTLAKDIYPGIAESEDLTKLQIDGQPLAAPEEITLAKAILDAMATAAKTATEALNAAGDAVLSKAINDKKISKERADKLWDAMLHSKNSLYKLIEARKMQFACPVTPPPPLKPGKVSVSGVTPYNVKPGDEVEFALTGEGLNLVTGVDSPTGFPDLVQSEIGPDGNLKFNVPEISPDGKRLKFQKVSVPYGVKPGEYEFTLKGGDNADKKVTSFKVKVVATDTRTSLEKAGDYAANTLKAKGELAVGLSKYPWQSQDVPYNLRSLGDREMPNLKADLRLGSIDDPVSIVGRGKAIVPVSEHAELLGNVQTGTRDAVHNGPDTYQLSGALGLGVRGNIWTTPQLRLLSAGVYAEGSVNGNANSAPNKFFYNGTDKNLNLRLTLDSEFGGVFAERQYTAFNWDNNSFPGGFSGHTEKWQLGLLGNVDLKKNQWAPKIYLKAAWLVSGKTAVPDAMADFAYEELSGVEAAARVDFKKFPKLPFYFYGGLQRLSQDGYNWGTLSRYFAGAGVKRPDIGTVELRGDLGDNPALYYGGGFKMGTLAYTLPEKLRQASGLTLKAQLYEFGKQTGFNGVAALDLVPLIFGPIKTSPLQTEK